MSLYFCNLLLIFTYVLSHIQIQYLINIENRLASKKNFIFLCEISVAFIF